MQRFPGFVYRHGDEPDPRFSLANERTFLAWLRTALALIASGIALELLGLDLHPGLRLSASLLLIAAGVLTPALGWVNWAQTERAMRVGRPLPSSLLGPAVGVAVAVAGVLVVLSIVFA